MANALKHAVVDSGIRAWRISQLAQISQTKLSHYMNGIKRCPADERHRLASVLSRTVDELFPNEQ